MSAETVAPCRVRPLLAPLAPGPGLRRLALGSHPGEAAPARAPGPLALGFVGSPLAGAGEHLRAAQVSSRFLPILLNL